MLTPSIRSQVRNLTFLYLTMAHGTDCYLTDREMETIIDSLHARYRTIDRSEIRDAILDALAVYQQTQNNMELATQAMMALRNLLSPEECEGVLQDLIRIAEADGVILDDEWGFLGGLAECWGIVLPNLQSEDAVTVKQKLDRGKWTVLHHLAFIFLVLAHGADNELDEQERRIMLKKLREWQPRLSEEDIEDIYEEAKERYSHGSDRSTLDESISFIKEHLPEEQRMAALNDLVQIANADGFFLDNEEDLINAMMNALEVPALANYGGYGKKHG